MAKNTNYLQMLNRGEWLEKILAEKIENWELKELFRQAVELIDLRYEIPYDHPFFTFLEEMTHQNKNWVSLFANWQPEKEEFPDESKPEFTAISTQLSIEFTSLLLKEIHSSGQPWNIALARLMENKSESQLNKNTTITTLKGLEKVFKYIGAKKFDSLYMQIGEKLLITNEKVTKVRVLLKAEESNKVSEMLTTSKEKRLPFPEFICRIFYDFLLFGGQEYYGYCVNPSCGKFIVSQRKGRRKTCSDKCRLQAHLNEFS